MTETQIIERLMLKALEVRKAQNTYFRFSNATNLKISKQKELELDNYLQQLKKQGYNPENQIDSTTQKGMFDV